MNVLRKLTGCVHKTTHHNEDLVQQEKNISTVHNSPDTRTSLTDLEQEKTKSNQAEFHRNSSDALPQFMMSDQ